MPGAERGTDRTIEYETPVAAAPEVVFAYFTDPARMLQWMGTEATLDPRPGGICRLNPAGHAVMSGRFVEVDPPHRIVFTWGWETELFETPPQSTLVEVSFVPDGAGTVVRLAHRRLNPNAVAFHRAGWEHYLPRLSAAAVRGSAGTDPWRDLEVATSQLRNKGVWLASEASPER